jgi:uncharacterized protein
MDRTLDRAECLGLLATRSLGRLLFTYGALPDVLPVEYRLDGDRVLIRLPLTSPAATATRNTVVAFEADEIDAHSLVGWSVTVVGRAHEIADPWAPGAVGAVGAAGAAGADLRSWGADGHDGLFSIAAERVAGHRLIATPPRARVQSGDGDPHRADGAA